MPENENLDSAPSLTEPDGSPVPSSPLWEAKTRVRAAWAAVRALAHPDKGGVFDVRFGRPQALVKVAKQFSRPTHDGGAPSSMSIAVTDRTADRKADESTALSVAAEYNLAAHDYVKALAASRHLFGLPSFLPILFLSQKEAAVEAGMAISKGYANLPTVPPALTWGAHFTLTEVITWKTPREEAKAKAEAEAEPAAEAAEADPEAAVKEAWTAVRALAHPDKGGVFTLDVTTPKVISYSNQAPSVGAFTVSVTDRTTNREADELLARTLVNAYNDAARYYNRHRATTTADPTPSVFLLDFLSFGEAYAWESSISFRRRRSKLGTEYQEIPTEPPVMWTGWAMWATDLLR